MALQLRPAHDALRLFSALADADDFSDQLSLYDIDLAAVQPIDPAAAAAAGVTALAILLSLSVAAAVGWVAIKGYERNHGSMGWGIVNAVTGYVLPVPAAIYTAVRG